MGQAIWIMAGAAAVGSVIGLASISRGGSDMVQPDVAQDAEQVAWAEPAPREDFNPSRSALAAAAFGLAALQPDTYDGALVLDIIHASPLDDARKTELADDLAAAEAGRADLDEVLQDVRVALAVE